MLKITNVQYILFFAGALGWIILFTPLELFGYFKNYIEEAKLLLALGTLLSFQILIYWFFINKNKKGVTPKEWFENKRALQISAIFFVVFIIGWSFLMVSRFGFSARGEDWNEAGVPVLGWQVLIALFIGMLFLGIEKKWQKKGLSSTGFTVLVFVVIWVVAGGIWAQTPVPNGYLNPGPYPPTYETYPFADAAKFDLMSQYALIGQGLNNGKSYNRPLYPTFLVFLHALSGQDYARNMQLQAALYGIFPALVFLIAKLLSSRGAGIAFAALIVMRGVNGIAATNMINLANQKQMLTDFPTAIAISLILFLCLIWFKKPQKLYLPILIGGVFALSLYLRQTILGFLPAILLLPFLFKDFNKKARALILGMFLLGVVAIIIPYELNISANNPNYTYPAVLRKIVSIADSHYAQTGDILQDEKTEGDSPPQLSSTERKENTGANSSQSDLAIVGNHFARNIITSVLVLPNTFLFENLRNTIKAENSFWRSSWDKRFRFEQLFLLSINFLLIALGIAFSIKRDLILGALPLVFFLGYNLANALGRTSGGRYIVPVDWILLLYFLIGLFQFSLFFFSLLQEKKDFSYKEAILLDQSIEKDINSRGIFLSLLILFAVVVILIMPDYLFPKKFNEVNENQIQEILLNYDLQGNHSYYKEFLADDKAEVIMGQVMYPRYYLADEGEFSFYFPYKTLDYSRTAFMLIGPNGTYKAVMESQDVSEIENLDEVIIIGCLREDGEEKYVDVDVLLIMTLSRQIYFRDPLSKTACNSSD
ncbi:MAG: hypothetical protein HN392_03270 [Anaerolineae bacterium]|nr:hypothetical protein [Anaerolineae bacterium]MBT7074709.1 hypothetical protein [Anaerolineae bacterium]